MQTENLTWGFVMKRLKLLDAFCGAGGASMGYYYAGFAVTGVDIFNQPNYPFTFHQGDGIEFIKEHGHEFDAIAASPPCKVHTSLKVFSGSEHTYLIPDTRDALISAGKPYIIENVVGAPLSNPIMLCGSSFDLGVQRHRLFESNVSLSAPLCAHERQASLSKKYPVKRYHSGKPKIVMSPVIGVFGRGQGLGPGEVDMWRAAMGISWMVRDELSQAIPPVYTQYIGSQLMNILRGDGV
jgi:DNA (cytosine-5)-methyltransferase 1